jgi:hypothetical protein
MVTVCTRGTLDDESWAVTVPLVAPILSPMEMGREHATR